MSPPVKEYVKKLPFSFSIDKLIKSWDYVADSNNFDHEGFKHNQLALTSSIYEYDGKNIWYEEVYKWCVFARRPTEYGVRALFTMPNPDLDI